jgi:2-succinyl-5-enolpyruvyl-6-hydroxy-3-cyclohexene-1-carboxylate synthase
MNVANPNVAAALALVDELSRLGVGAVCVSPGSRSSALVSAVKRTRALKSWVILDERSAAYFAIGAARERRAPVALICTSGTAAGNWMPAMIEASLSHVPLIVISADRPPELQDCHAPQTVDQRRLFGVHSRLNIDLPAPTGAEPDDYFRTVAFRAVDAALGMPPGPVHVNFPTREPLIDVEEERAALAAAPNAPAPSATSGAPHAAPAHIALHQAVVRPAPRALEALRGKLRAYRRGVILCGPGTTDHFDAPALAAGADDAAGGAQADATAAAICELARRLCWPILADPLSGMRFGRRDLSHIVDAYDVTLRDPHLCDALFPDAVIQFGRPLTSKPANTFFTARQRPPLYLVAAPWGSWPDPGRRATDAIRAAPAELARALLDTAEPAPPDWLSRWVEPARQARRYLNDALDADAESALSECALFPALLRLISDGGALHVGNSMPVRDLDTFGESAPRRIDVFCNRGANGIDGVLSAAAGAAAARGRATVAVLGDLSFLHDIGALKAAAAHARHLVVIVVNNDGGGIFSFLPQAALGETFETYFATAHGLGGLEPAARLYGARYAHARTIGEFTRACEVALGAAGLHLIEIRSQRADNVALHRRLIDGAIEAARRVLPAAL